MYVVQAVNEDNFKCFREQLAEFTKEMAAANNATRNAMKNLEAQQQEGEAMFAERVSEDKAKFVFQRETLERELQKLKDADKKVTAQIVEWVGKQEEAHSNLMKYLENEEYDSAEAHYCQQFGALIESINNLSHQAMDDQFGKLKDNLDALIIEKNQLEVSIADQKRTIGSMCSALKPTCGVTYKERNSLRIAMLNEVTKVRTEYQKSRLLEESLKAKLST